VRAKDLLQACLAGVEPDLRALLRKPLIVPETRPALRVLEAFRQTGTHLAVLIDEYGGVSGLVTHHDLMEAVVGDIPQPEGTEDAAIIRRGDGSYWVDGALPVDELEELLGGRFADEDEAGRYHTLAGMMLSHLGRIPAEGDSFEREGWRFEVVDMDGNRIDKVLIQSVPTPAS
jgi:putative hemolysin